MNRDAIVCQIRFIYMVAVACIIGYIPDGHETKAVDAVIVCGFLVYARTPIDEQHTKKPHTETMIRRVNFMVPLFSRVILWP